MKYLSNNIFFSQAGKVDDSTFFSENKGRSQDSNRFFLHEHQGPTSNMLGLIFCAKKPFPTPEKTHKPVGCSMAEACIYLSGNIHYRASKRGSYEETDSRRDKGSENEKTKKLWKEQTKFHLLFGVGWFLRNVSVYDPTCCLSKYTHISLYYREENTKGKNNLKGVN